MNTFFAKRSAPAQERDAPAAARPERTVHTEPSPPLDRNPSLALYLAAAVVQACALATVRFEMGDPTFSNIAIVLSVIGLSVSYYLRTRGVSAQVMRIGALVIGILFLYTLRGQGIFGAFMPPELLGATELLLISALAFTASMATFVMLTDESVVFSCVWAIAIVGLAGTININRELLICFAIFFFAAAFLLVHQNYLAQRKLNGTSADPIPARILRIQLGTAALAWIATLVLGVLVAIPLQIVGRGLTLKQVMERILDVPPAANQNRRRGRPRIVFDNPLEFPVGRGPTSEDTSEVMYVTSDSAHYWRGRTLERYTGNSWINLEERRGEYLSAASGPDSKELYIFDVRRPNALPRKKTLRISNHFKTLPGIVGSIPAAAEPVRIQIGAATLLRRYDQTYGGRISPGAEYDVDSEVSVATPEDLRRASTDYPPEITRLYQDPGRRSEALRQLARQATQGARNPYDKAEAIRAFVSQRCVYTLDARAVPTGKDAAEFFLNESREGYCDLFATACTLLCRYAGLPARIATGFNPGTPTGLGNRTYVLRNSNRHAWTEVYFAGYGWFPFDATADTITATSAPTIPEPVRKETLWERLLGALPKVLAGIGALGILGVVVFERLRRRQDRGPSAGLSGENARRIVRIYQSALRQAHRLGASRARTMTAQEHLQVVHERLGAPPTEALKPLAYLADCALFAPDPPADEAVRQAQAHLSRFVAAAREAAARPRPADAR